MIFKISKSNISKTPPAQQNKKSVNHVAGINCQPVSTYRPHPINHRPPTTTPLPLPPTTHHHSNPDPPLPTYHQPHPHHTPTPRRDHLHEIEDEGGWSRVGVGETPVFLIS